MVELLVIIGIIGILSVIGVVSFESIQANQRDSERSSKTDIIAEALEKYYTKNGEYPTCAALQDPAVTTSVLVGLDPNILTTPSDPAGTNSIVCTNPSSSSDKIGYINGVDQYTLEYYDESTASVISLASRKITCPAGFIPVPGSATYSTNNFCVMKFEAKIQGNDIGEQTYSSSFVPESRVSGTPWVKISQTSAIAEASTVCTGCHLITDAEWLTIAQNVLRVESNWSGGSVGNGYIYSGHNDSRDGASGGGADPLAASTDEDGYFGTGNVAPSNQRRTLTLSNGEVIWDLAGNVWEWTNGTAAPQPTIVMPCKANTTSYGWFDWTEVNNSPNIVPDSSPTFTGISGASSWGSDQGVGRIYCKTNETSVRAIARGGAWYSNWTGPYAGVLQMFMGEGTSVGYNNEGFRVTR